MKTLMLRKPVFEQDMIHWKSQILVHFLRMKEKKLTPPRKMSVCCPERGVC